MMVDPLVAQYVTTVLFCAVTARRRRELRAAGRSSTKPFATDLYGQWMTGEPIRSTDMGALAVEVSRTTGVPRPIVSAILVYIDDMTCERIRTQDVVDRCQQLAMQALIIQDDQDPPEAKP